MDQQKKHRLGTVSKNIFTGGLKQVYCINITLISDVYQDKKMFGSSHCMITRTFTLICLLLMYIFISMIFSF